MLRNLLSHFIANVCEHFSKSLYPENTFHFVILPHPQRPQQLGRWSDQRLVSREMERIFRTHDYQSRNFFFITTYVWSKILRLQATSSSPGRGMRRS